MRQFSFHLPRAYRLKPVGHREEDALSQLRIGASNQSVLVPFSPGLDYIVVPSRGARAPDRERRFSRRDSGRPAVFVGAGAPLAFFVKKKKYLKYPEFSLFSVGPKAERKRFTRFNQDTMNIGVVSTANLSPGIPSFSMGGRRRRRAASSG